MTECFHDCAHYPHDLWLKYSNFTLVLQAMFYLWLYNIHIFLKQYNILLEHLVSSSNWLLPVHVLLYIYSKYIIEILKNYRFGIVWDSRL